MKKIFRAKKDPEIVSVCSKLGIQSGTFKAKYIADKSGLTPVKRDLIAVVATFALEDGREDQFGVGADCADCAVSAEDQAGMAMEFARAMSAAFGVDVAEDCMDLRSMDGQEVTLIYRDGSIMQFRTACGVFPEIAA